MAKKNTKNNEWQLQEAKARFSELFRRAREKGPQRVTRHGREAVVVMSAEEYEQKIAPPPKESLYDFLRRSPLVGSGIKIERIDGPFRKVKL